MPSAEDGLLCQDLDRKLSRALATKPDARLHAREAAAAIARETSMRQAPIRALGDFGSTLPTFPSSP